MYKNLQHLKVFFKLNSIQIEYLSLNSLISQTEQVPWNDNNFLLVANYVYTDRLLFLLLSFIYNLLNLLIFNVIIKLQQLDLLRLNRFPLHLLLL